MTDQQASMPVPLSLRATLYGVIVVALMLAAIRYLNAASLYPGVATDAGVGPAKAATRDDVREISFQADDGTQLYGWVQGSDAAPCKIIQFMGNAEQVGPSAAMYAESCAVIDAQFLLFDYRGFGNSDGRPSERGLYSDARGAWQFATTELGWKPTQIVIWGRSLGGGPATKLAHELVQAGSAPRALILEAPFTSVHDMAQIAMPHLGKPEWLIYELYDNLGRAPGLNLPVFHFHGTADEIIPYEQGERLHKALPGRKEFLRLAGVGHNDIWNDKARAALVRARIRQFIEAQP